MQNGYNRTMRACFVGYIVQAIVNNYAPLLFLTFQQAYGISLAKITMLVTINFAIQLLVDLVSVAFVDRIGYRISMMLAHFCSAAGLVLLTVLPEMCADAYAGLLAAVAVYAVGGGLLEVLVSPVMHACPTDNKEKAMSLLHSFYCWGHVGVVLLSTAFFGAFGVENWKILALVWAVIPLVNGFVFARVPIASLVAEGEKGKSVRALFADRMFWLFLVMMLCAGAAEQSVSQWASTFAEQGLGVSKAVGDLAGPMAFAVAMGISRMYYGRMGERINLDRFMIGSAALCVAAYLAIALIPCAAAGLIGCGVCGLSVGIMWPGTFSKATQNIPRGGTALFALLALAGDLGCSGGPTLVGMLSSAAGDNLRMGILAGTLFPAVLLAGVLLVRGRRRAQTDEPRRARFYENKHSAG